MTRKQEVKNAGFLLVNSLQKLQCNGRPENTQTNRWQVTTSNTGANTVKTEPSVAGSTAVLDKWVIP